MVQSNMNDCKTDLFDPKIEPLQLLSIHIKVDMVIMAMKRYSTFPRSLESNPNNQMHLSYVLMAYSFIEVWFWPIYRCYNQRFIYSTGCVVFTLERDVFLSKEKVKLIAKLYISRQPHYLEMQEVDQIDLESIGSVLKEDWFSWRNV